jgi:hypothetical protein
MACWWACCWACWAWICEMFSRLLNNLGRVVFIPRAKKGSIVFHCSHTAHSCWTCRTSYCVMRAHHVSTSACTFLPQEACLGTNPLELNGYPSIPAA